MLGRIYNGYLFCFGRVEEALENKASPEGNMGKNGARAGQRRRGECVKMGG